MNRPEITYRPRPEVTPVTELSALAAVYKLCLDRRGKKGTATSTANRPDDATMEHAKGVSDVSR